MVEIDVLIAGSVTGSVEAQCNLVTSGHLGVMTHEGRRLSEIAYRPSLAGQSYIQTKTPCIGYMNRLSISITEAAGEARFVGQTETQLCRCDIAKLHPPELVQRHMHMSFRGGNTVRR
jgi:hypothetical protein